MIRVKSLDDVFKYTITNLAGEVKTKVYAYPFEKKFRVITKYKEYQVLDKDIIFDINSYDKLAIVEAFTQAVNTQVNIDDINNAIVYISNLYTKLHITNEDQHF